ncbi:hypothetical protein [Methanobrevibacter sp. V14]|uniref:hypothetical protein n=1 Tax=Methanobrevibacter sp. V14 TaxID=3064280 RepID=UPI002737659B|nr:hypothetical protein [Methanobrevibacter sp. V14]
MDQIIEDVKAYLITVYPWYVSTRCIHDEIPDCIRQDKLLRLLKQESERDNYLQGIKSGRSWLWRYEGGILSL